MPPAYNPQEVEVARYKWWEEKGYFKPEVAPGVEPFVVIMPPPNVTGSLHIGHALTATVEDTLVRWHRMRGEPTLWLPGTDHAGIATQYVVEQALAREEKDRRSMGRRAFLDRVWEWVRKYGGTIQDQHRRLGASCDWSRERFTLDPGPSRAVRTTFVNLFDKGRIYRGERMINWCPRCLTVLSDLETEYEDAEGSLWHIRYLYADGSGRSVTVATTRPETFLGDTAVAVNPDDERYKDLIGKHVRLPIIAREVPVIADRYVDMSFGTGALKITPAHDPNDFEIGQRHGLPRIEVMLPDGMMNANAGPYVGMDRFAARGAIVKDLERAGLLAKVEPYANRVGHCYRCQTIVEPRVSIQWFVETKPLAAPAIEAVEDGRIRIVPERFTTVYLNWMNNIRDWCISRQLWWGHRIPAWFCASCDGETLYVSLREPMRGPDGAEIMGGGYTDLRELGLSHARTVEMADRIDAGPEATPIVSLEDPQACPRCGGTELVQDPDVLDTWFSSGLWPHSTLGWPEQTDDFSYFYPTSVMETGYDILFFWVARMIMMGLENTGDVPFRTVYLHGLVRDAQRQKMSKTRGNVVDPLDSIAEYGTDALRMALTISTTPGNDIAFSPARMEAGRNFANKLWNAARFVVRNLEETTKDYDVSAELAKLGSSRRNNFPTPVHREDKWIVSRLQRLTASVTQLLTDFQLGQAEQALRDFLWDEFFDWYIELAKVRLRDGDPTPLPYLVGVLETSVRLLHPFMPFVTEEIWQNLVGRAPGLARGRDSIMVSPYPEADESLLDDTAEREMADVVGVIRAIRNARAEAKAPAGQMIEALVDPGAFREAFEVETPAVKALARVGILRLLAPNEPRPDPSTVTTAVVGGATLYMPLAGLVDTAAERERLQKELEEARARVKSLQDRLANETFRSRAPAQVVQKEEERLAETQERVARLEEQLARLG
jgi:valyl-tRNA synthetase